MTAPPPPHRTSPITPVIALVVALSSERRTLERCLPSLQRQPWEESWLSVGEYRGRGVAVLQAGIGPERARSAVLAASRRLSFSGVWSLGFAGGLHEALLTGDLVCPEAVLREAAGVVERVAASPSCQAVRAALATQALAVHAGGLLSVGAPLRTPETKRLAQRRTGALAVDMEAAGVADAAGFLGIPWLALKAVVDPVAEPLPEFLDRVTTSQGNLNWMGLIESLVATGRRQTLRRLGRAAARAAGSLRRGIPVALQAWATLTPTQVSG